MNTDSIKLYHCDKHKQITVLENRIKFLERRVATLEAEVVCEQAS